MIAALAADPGLAIVLTGALVGASGALLGAFLVLRGSAMLTDAISHSIVFGIVLVWLATGARDGPLQIAGAAATGILTVVLSETLARSRLVRMDAAVGLVFPALFAAGVLLINLYGRNAHIDLDAVLLGEIGFVWLDTLTLGGIAVPRAVVWLTAMLAVNALFVGLFWKELKLATFDPALAAALGFAPATLFYALLTLTSATAVAAFDAVGAILFVAFVTVPAATGLMLTDRLSRVVAIALAVAVASSLAGYRLAVVLDVSIGGMMALTSGVFLLAAIVAAPGRGLIARRRRTRGG
jgi:manganese/zinc/iron transport system permease protein